MIHEYNAKVARVVDGDTVWLNVDLGFRICVQLDFRLYKINAPEMVGASKVAGLAAKAELERLLALGPIRVESFKDDKTDKYGRWLGVLFVKTPTGELNVNDALLKGNFAAPYLG